MSLPQANTNFGAFERDALVALVVIYYIEEHALLPADQIESARKGLHALFLHTSSEETLLRKLIRTLRETRQLHKSFSKIAGVVAGVRRCAETSESKSNELRGRIARLNVNAEENAAFVGPFLDFAQAFMHRTRDFARFVQEYLELREHEARCRVNYDAAKAAREQIRNRLSGALAAQAAADAKRDVVATFDYGEAEHNLRHAKREARVKEQQIMELLDEIKLMCEMAKNPTMRENAGLARARYEDVYRLFADVTEQHPRLLFLKETVTELFRMYQHAYGIFHLDFDNLRKEIDTMSVNADAYFESKEEDQDITTKKEKLRMIEGLIPFLEAGAGVLREPDMDTYEKFTRRISALIDHTPSAWQHIGEGLLRAKVQAEAELSTRL